MLGPRNETYMRKLREKKWLRKHNGHTVARQAGSNPPAYRCYTCSVPGKLVEFHG